MKARCVNSPGPASTALVAQAFAAAPPDVQRPVAGEFHTVFSRIGERSLENTNQHIVQMVSIWTGHRAVPDLVTGTLCEVGQADE